MLTPTVQEPGTMRCSMQTSKQADSPDPGIRRPPPQFRGRYSRPWQWSPVGTMPATFVRRAWAPRLDSASCHGRISAIRSRIWQRIFRWHRPPFPTNPQPIGIPCGAHAGAAVLPGRVCIDRELVCVSRISRTTNDEPVVGTAACLPARELRALCRLPARPSDLRSGMEYVQPVTSARHARHASSVDRIFFRSRHALAIFAAESAP